MVNTPPITHHRRKKDGHRQGSLDGEGEDHTNLTSFGVGTNIALYSRWVGGTEQMLMQSKYFKKMHIIKFCDVFAEIKMLTEILTLFI